MKNLIQTVFFKLLSITFLAVAALLIIVYCFQYAPTQKKLLRSGLFDKVKTVFSLSGNTLTKAIQAHDDIMMLTTIESIMKIEDVSAAYILDNNCKVITHDKTAEWGRIYADEQSKKAVESKKIIRQASASGFLFSGPLTSSATLCLGISSQKLEESISSLNKEILFTALIIFIVAASGFFWLIYNMLFLKIKKLSEGLRSLEIGGSGRLPEDGPDDEFSRITKLINGVLDNYGRAAGSGQERQKENNCSRFLSELANMNSAAIIIVGSDNKIISLNHKAAMFLGVVPGEAEGKHVLDAIKLTEMLALIKQASEKSGDSAEASITGRKVKAISAGGGAGIIIQIED